MYYMCHYVVHNTWFVIVTWDVFLIFIIMSLQHKKNISGTTQKLCEFVFSVFLAGAITVSNLTP